MNTQTKTTAPKTTPQERELFERRAENPHTWKAMARYFARAADTLEATEGNPLDGTDVAMAVLLAYAVENALKGRWVAVKGSPVRNGKLAPSFATHNVETLAAEAGVAVDSDLADDLTRIAQGGKYPVGLFPGEAGQGFVPSDLFPRIRALLKSLDL